MILAAPLSVDTRYWNIVSTGAVGVRIWNPRLNPCGLATGPVPSADTNMLVPGGAESTANISNSSPPPKHPMVRLVTFAPIAPVGVASVQSTAAALAIVERANKFTTKITVFIVTPLRGEFVVRRL